jgi:hypothetical protein
MNPNRIPVALAIAAVIIGSSAALTYAGNRDLIGDEAAQRIMQVMFGLVLAAYANVAPKELGRWRSMEAAKRSQSAQRVGGWSLTLAGLGYAALWALAPVGFAGIAGVVLIAGATLLAVSYAARAFVLCRRAETGPESA